MPVQFDIKLLYDFCYRFIQVFPHPLLYLLQLRLQLLLTSNPFYPKSAFLTLSTVVRESEKIKFVRFLPFLYCIYLCKPSEFDYL